MKKHRSVTQDTTNTDELFRLARVGISAYLVVAAIYAIVIWPGADHVTLIGWLLTTSLVGAIRIRYVSRYRNTQPPVAEQQKWERGFIGLAAVSALMLASTAFLFFREDWQFGQWVCSTIICGTAMVAISTLAVSPLCYRVYVLCLLIPLIFRLLLVARPPYAMLALLVAAFGVMMIQMSQSVFGKLMESRSLLESEQYRTEVMEMMAKGAPLQQILKSIVIGVENQSPKSICSILLADDAHKKIEFGAAPNLPEFYNKAIDGLPIGPDVGCCGTAMFTGQRVVVEDIRTSPLWVPYSELAAKAGLQSCWSEPVKSSSGRTLGAFAIYHRVPAMPAAKDIQRIEVAAYIAGLAIERHRLEQERDLAALIFHNSSEGMVVVDADEHVISVNEAFTEISGYRIEDLKGKTLDITAREPADHENFRKVMDAVLATGKGQGEVWTYRRNGERMAGRITINSIYDVDGSISRRVILISDITEQKHSDELIWRQANYDPLIGLPNRRLFRDRLEQEIKKANRNGSCMALLFLDLDRFKEINDSLGHEAGDLLLIEAAKRISDCVRDSDTVARLGGDEFTVILPEIEDRAAIERVAGSLIQQMVTPFDLDGDQVYISVSIGITVFPDDASEVDELLKNADLAMYAAKNSGRNRFSYFVSANQQDAQQRVQMVKDLRLALPAREFSLEFQPIIDVRTHHIRKAEALLRWKHPRNGMVSPARFIPRAEETGLINEIGDWVFREAARVSKRWTELGGEDFEISFNVSPVQFRAANTCSNWLRYLAEIGVPGNNMIIEITEGLLLDAAPHVVNLVRQFQDGGMRIAIDDFGTGYSSLSYLKKFDIDFLKIDQSFVRDLATDISDRALAETIVVMGHKLGLKVVAEGVETDQQRGILAEAGCDFAQGYLFSRPMPEQEFEKMLTQHRLASIRAVHQA